MAVLCSIALFVLAEIGGAWLVWQGVREPRGLAWMGAGIIALGLYGFVATLLGIGRIARPVVGVLTRVVDPDEHGTVQEPGTAAMIGFVVSE